MATVMTFSTDNRSSQTLLWISTVLIILGLIALWAKQHESEAFAIRALPRAERVALYQRTLTTLRIACRYAARAPLRTHCEQQAQFITLFPECDMSCKKLATQFSAKPSR